jgi:hypothetical protein
MGDQPSISLHAKSSQLLVYIHKTAIPTYLIEDMDELKNHRHKSNEFIFIK